MTQELCVACVRRVEGGAGALRSMGSGCLNFIHDRWEGKAGDGGKRRGQGESHVERLG